MFSKLIRIVNFFFGFIVFLIVVGIFIFYQYTKNLPSYEQILKYNPETTVNVYAKDGAHLSSFYKENRTVLPSEYIPQLLKDAIISAEDRSFYTNSGLDFSGITRSIFTNIYGYFTGQSRLVGGSTITQQIIKNTVLSSEKTLKRKLQEAKLALVLTRYLTKEQILERYINHIYLGNNSYGFAQASLSYFNKSINELAIEEIAMLAALPQAPSRLDPTRSVNRERLLKRRNWVITQMSVSGAITEEEAEKAIEKSIVIDVKRYNAPLGSEFIADESKKKLLSLFDGNEDYLYSGGFSVYTTISPKIQKMTTFALRKGLLDFEKSRYPWNGPNDHFSKKEDYLQFVERANKTEIHPLRFAWVSDKTNDQIQIILDRETPAILIKETNNKIFKSVRIGDVVTVFETDYNSLETTIDGVVGDEERVKILNNKQFQVYQAPRVNGAMVVMNVNNGNILSMAGGFNFYKNQFNRATQALRQPGSLFKPLVYLTGLESGFKPYSILMDEPLEIKSQDSSAIWKPKNYGDNYVGPITMQSALERSKNLATLYLAREIGIEPIIENAKKFGLMPEKSKAKNFSTVFGSQEVTLLDMMRFYSIIANGGFDIKINLIDFIQTSAGMTIWRSNKDVCDCKVNKNTLDLIDPVPPLIKIFEKERLISQKDDYQLLQMMEGVVKRGTARNLSYLGENIAGKTGTSNNSNDLWFLGATKNVAFGVYVGFDKPKSLGEKATGGNTAIPIIKILLNQMKKEHEINFDKPFYSEAEIRKNNLSIETEYELSNSENYQNNSTEMKNDEEVYYTTPND